MAHRLEVELADLRGYADVVDDIAGYLRKMAGHAETHCPDADFGPLLEPMSAEYSKLVPQLITFMDHQQMRMESSAVALDQTLADLRKTDADQAGRFGPRPLIVDDGKTASFYGNPMGPSDFRDPAPREGDLPEINFGFPFDQLATALNWVCGYDIRREVTDRLVGDVVGLSKQAAAWYTVGSAASSYGMYLDNANQTIAKTWRGDSHTQTSAAMAAWVTSLGKQHTDLHEVAMHLEDIASDAVDMAQLAVDLIMYAVDLVASAWASQWIPIYGQAKFASKAWDAFKLVKKAWDALQEFLDVLGLVVGALGVIYNEFDTAELPAAPSNG